MASRVTGSRKRSMRCWPTGRPMDCCSWSRVKVKMRVSELIDFLVERSALDQILC